MAPRRPCKAAAPKKPPTPRGSPQLSRVTKSTKAPSEDGSKAKKKNKRWTVAEVSRFCCAPVGRGAFTAFILLASMRLVVWCETHRRQQLACMAEA